jgi:hypothetical protein
MPLRLEAANCPRESLGLRSCHDAPSVRALGPESVDVSTSEPLAFVLPPPPLLLMLSHWLRTALERIGIHLPFPGVICVEGSQTISIDEAWRAFITTRRKLVFIEPPSAGDLCDTCGLGLERPVSSLIYSSPDAVELGREERARGSLTLYWWPRDPIALYTIYEHESGWKPVTTFDAPALCLEYTCDMRTGVFSFECLAPIPFEAAVIFKRPRWPQRLTERAAVEHALKRLAGGTESLRIPENGRVTCEVRGATVGERYILVAFRKCGVADCERWLQETSMLGRAQRAIDNWAHAIRG